MSKLSMTDEEVQELLKRLKVAGEKHHTDLDGVAVLHAAAAIHEGFIVTGLMEKMLNALDHVGLLPKPQPIDAWLVGFEIVTSPQGIAALCYALNIMAEETLNGLKEVVPDMGPKDLRQEEIN